uniref:Uncharacterized protein n=1 Tax=viral metagenome TaxID=1070528 RepID=A0A6C0AF38_9ZZZZ
MHVFFFYNFILIIYKNSFLILINIRIPIFADWSLKKQLLFKTKNFEGG